MDNPVKLIYKYKNLNKRVNYEIFIFLGTFLDDNVKKILRKIENLSFYDSLIELSIKEVDILINAAGPYSLTAKPLIDSCLRTKTHYIDITGEIDVFVYAQSKHEDAKDAGVVVCPGVGFDVIPTDCLSYMLKDKLSDANELNRKRRHPPKAGQVGRWSS